MSSPARARRPRSRGSRAGAGRAAARRRWRGGWRPSGARPWAPARPARRRAARRRRRAPRAGSCASTPSSAARCSGFSASWESGTWWERNVPSTSCPSTSCGPVQPLGVTSTIIGQRGRSTRPSSACGGLDRGDLVDHLVERRGHLLVHRRGVVALHEARRVAVALHQRAQLVARDAGEHRRVGDLGAVEVQDRQHGAVVGGVEELVGVPARGQRSGLRLAVADDAADEQVRVVEHRAVGVHERVAQLAALVDRPRRLGRDVAGDAAGERELAEQHAHARLVGRDAAGSARCRCPRGTCWPRARGRRGPAR